MTPPQLSLFQMDSDPLPLQVARKWAFPLQHHNVDEAVYYSVQDWIAGLTGSTTIKASEMWRQMKDTQTRISITSLKYQATDGKTYQRPFTTDEGLYLIAQDLRSMEDRPVLEAIKGFLAKSGAFLDQMRRDPETAHRAAQAALQAKQARLLEQGRSPEWVDTRFKGIQSRNAFTEALKQAVADPSGPFYGQATNTVYKGLFGRNSTEIRAELGLRSTDNPRDYMTQASLHYVGLVETLITAKLAQYAPHDPIPPGVALQIIKAIADLMGGNAQQMATLLGLDIVTGRPLLGGGK
jgi:hypothetical protein